MSIYESQICDICGERFVAGDDIVVCPDCGAPYHRSCWKKLGHCAHEARHRTGFEWKKIPLTPPVLESSDAVKCPQCGALMPAGTKYCENCGYPLEEAASQADTSRRDGPLNFDEYMERQRAAAERELRGEIDGVPIRDMAVYMGPNAHYYVSKFRIKEADPRYRPFCWSAAFFAPLYFLCRKLYKLALVSALINALLSVPTFIIMGVSQGLLPASLMFSGISTLAQVLGYVEIAVGIVFGFIAVPAYKKAVVRDLKKYKEQSNGDQVAYYSMVTSKSGLSKVGMIITAFVRVCYLFQLFS